MNERHQILDNQEFWTQLEHDATRWLESSPDRTLRRFWLDGFNPETATNTKQGINVDGSAWVHCFDGGQVARGVKFPYPSGTEAGGHPNYRFVASIPQKLLHMRKINFEIKGLSLDADQQFLQVEIGLPKQ